GRPGALAPGGLLFAGAAPVPDSPLEPQPLTASASAAAMAQLTREIPVNIRMARARPLLRVAIDRGQYRVRAATRTCMARISSKEPATLEPPRGGADA